MKKRFEMHLFDVFLNMTKKRLFLFITFSVLAVLWAGVIFYFSATEGTQSLEQSNGFVEVLDKIASSGENDKKDLAKTSVQKPEEKETEKEQPTKVQTQQNAESDIKQTQHTDPQKNNTQSDNKEEFKTPVKRKPFTLKENTSKLTEAEKNREERVKSSIEKNKNIPMFAALNTVARKFAHISSYVLLAFLTYFAVGFVSYFPNRISKIPWASVTLCVFFACTDEYHQLFVNGRSGRISDVIVDSFGVFVGTLAAYWLSYELAKIKYRKKNASNK